jgi:hypothetical protein
MRGHVQGTAGQRESADGLPPPVGVQGPWISVTSEPEISRLFADPEGHSGVPQLGGAPRAEPAHKIHIPRGLRRRPVGMSEESQLLRCQGGNIVQPLPTSANHEMPGHHRCRAFGQGEGLALPAQDRVGRAGRGSVATGHPIPKGRPSAGAWQAGLSPHRTWPGAGVRPAFRAPHLMQGSRLAVPGPPSFRTIFAGRFPLFRRLDEANDIDRWRGSLVEAAEREADVESRPRGVVDPGVGSPSTTLRRAEQICGIDDIAITTAPLDQSKSADNSDRVREVFARCSLWPSSPARCPTRSRDRP